MYERGPGLRGEEKKTNRLSKAWEAKTVMTKWLGLITKDNKVALRMGSGPEIVLATIRKPTNCD